MPISVAELAAAAAPIFHVSVDEIMSKRRFPEFILARAAIAHAAKASGRGDSEIGRAMGNRDPDTIENARKRAGEMCAKDREFAAACDYLVVLARDWAIAHTHTLLFRHTVHSVKQGAKRA